MKISQRNLSLERRKVTRKESNVKKMQKPIFEKILTEQGPVNKELRKPVEKVKLSLRKKAIQVSNLERNQVKKEKYLTKAAQRVQASSSSSTTSSSSSLSSSLKENAKEKEGNKVTSSKKSVVKKEEFRKVGNSTNQSQGSKG